MMKLPEKLIKRSLNEKLAGGGERPLGEKLPANFEVLPTPEKERAPDQVTELLLTPISGQRKEEDTHLHAVSICDLPMKPWGSAKCEKTFPNENYLRMHAKKYHEQGQPRCWMCA